MSEEIVNRLEHLKAEASSRFQGAHNPEELYQAKVTYLGKKGRLTEILKGLAALSNTERPRIGALANQIKNTLEGLYAGSVQTLQQRAIQESLSRDRIDVTLPGRRFSTGRLHPLTQVLHEMKAIFSALGFDIFEGPEVETDYYNFEALNIPKDHPARDMQDTFYIDSTRLLRTHTSPVQIHVMKHQKPPIQMIAPGTVYRRDSDCSHTPMFHQIEGLVVDRGISFANLKAVIELFIQKLFAKKVAVKFRPSFFPFTEPSAEVDIACVICAGEGCRVCKQTGWLEIMGCGMVDPEVFKAVRIDQKKYQGFAFGVGIERVAMIQYGINDIRLFFENDHRFLEQFY